MIILLSFKGILVLQGRIQRLSIKLLWHFWRRTIACLFSLACHFYCMYNKGNWVRWILAQKERPFHPSQEQTDFRNKSNSCQKYLWWYSIFPTKSRKFRAFHSFQQTVNGTEYSGITWETSIFSGAHRKGNLQNSWKASEGLHLSCVCSERKRLLRVARNSHEREIPDLHQMGKRSLHDQHLRNCHPRVRNSKH